MLSDAKVRAAKPRAKGYRLPDGHGLYLFVTPRGMRVWRWRYERDGREQTLSLGAYPAVGLADARSRRDDARRRLLAGADPKEPTVASSLPSLAEVARNWHAINASRWKPHHAIDVLRGLERDIFPTLGKTAIQDITAPKLLTALRAMEARGAIDTAHRVRGRLADVFAFAIGEGLADSNPAEAIRAALMPMPKGGHRPASTTLESARAVLMEAETIPAFPATRLALRFLALTVQRPGEVGGAEWAEMENLEGSAPLWRIPAHRMKAAREHLVPLSRQAVEVLKTARILSDRMAHIFPSSTSSRRPISTNALNVLMRRAGLSGIHVPHGWRTTFSTVMNERFPADRLVIDLMLAHAGARGAVEAAYNRAEHLDRRRELAQIWADLLMKGLAAPETLMPMRRRT